MGCNVFCKIGGYIKAEQFDVFIFIKNAQFGQNPEKIFRVLNTGPGGYGSGNLMILAVFWNR